VCMSVSWRGECVCVCVNVKLDEMKKEYTAMSRWKISD